MTKIKLLMNRWNEIIGTSHKLMKRFQLNLKNPREAMDMQRKYQSAIIAYSDLSLDVILHQNLESLELTVSRNIELSTLINALNKLTALKVFNAKYITFIDMSEFSDSLKTVSTNIEHLECVVEIVHIFACCSVKKLGLRCDDTINENSKKVVIDFLNKQTNLEDLNLCGEAFGGFFALPDFIDLKCSLKKFKHLKGTRNFPYYEAFIRFLSRHVRTLTSLEVNFFTEPPFGLQMIHKYALESIVNLKHLKMDYDKDEIPFIELPTASQITKNLESLSLCRLSMDMNINKSIFDLLPNLKHLHFEYTADYDDELLNCISERCPKLESLNMFSLNEEISGIYFPKLKEINIDICHDEESFCLFFNRHSQTLERITINIFEYFTRSFAKAILSCPNLNYLKLNLLELTIGSLMMIHEILSRNKIFTLILPEENYKFIFPDDNAIFYTLFYDKKIECAIMCT